jgi:phage-related protein
VIFCLLGNDVYVLHGFLKTTQKTPRQDLDLARKRMKEVLK